MLDWDPNDPDAVKVHYDVSAWNLEQRAELSAALAEEEIAHVWSGDELVVPEMLEPRADALFERLDDELGPFPIALAEDEAAVEYGLDEWPDDDRDTLTAALVEAGVAHRWEAATIFVAAEAEPVVDELLDGIEAGTVVAGAAAAPPDDALSRSVRRLRPAGQGSRRPNRPGGCGRARGELRSSPSSLRTRQERLARRGRVERPARRGE